MNFRIWHVLAVAITFLPVRCAPAPVQEEESAPEQGEGVPEKGGEDETGPYEVVEDWPQPLKSHEGWTWGSTGGIFAETPDKIFIFQRGELPVDPARTESATRGEPRWEHVLIVVDGDGKLIDNWKQHEHLFKRPHKVLISPYDPEKHVWLVDDGNHQVFKFTNGGEELVMTLGEAGVEGSDETHFARPTDIAWLPDGTFFVSDGYTNTRVVKFSKDGEYLMEWGTPGTGPGEFNLVHAVATDDQRRVYVSDRSNHRIQIFDENGNYLDEWANIRSPYCLYMAADQHLWVGDGVTNKILKYDLSGKLLYSWGTYGSFPGGLWGPHQLSVDQDGNLYIAEVHNGRAQKFRPKEGADPTKRVGHPVRLPTS